MANTTCSWAWTLSGTQMEQSEAAQSKCAVGPGIAVAFETRAHTHSLRWLVCDRVFHHCIPSIVSAWTPMPSCVSRSVGFLPGVGLISHQIVTWNMVTLSAAKEEYAQYLCDAVSAVSSMSRMKQEPPTCAPRSRAPNNRSRTHSTEQLFLYYLDC